MFVSKKRFKELDKIVKTHNDILFDKHVGTGYNGKNFYDAVENGLVSKIKSIEKENKKLKAILAELVDYVYKE